VVVGNMDVGGAATFGLFLCFVQNCPLADMENTEEEDTIPI
jgi:hypothetical protein